MVNTFYSVSLLVLVLNILNAIGWTTIPKMVLFYPTVVIGAAWVWILIVATIVVADHMKKHK